MVFLGGLASQPFLKVSQAADSIERDTPQTPVVPDWRSRSLFAGPGPRLDDPDFLIAMTRQARQRDDFKGQDPRQVRRLARAPASDIRKHHLEEPRLGLKLVRLKIS